MPYAEGRTFHDADSHVMETPGWLASYADPAFRERIPSYSLGSTGLSDAVRAMISGIGVMTGVYRTAPWTNPEVDGDTIKVGANYGGGLLATTSLTFTFDDADRIRRVEQINTSGGGGPGTDRMPEFVKGIVNAALANNTPMIVAYTDENGAPVLSPLAWPLAYRWPPCPCRRTEQS